MRATFQKPDQPSCKKHVIERCGVKLDPAIVTEDDVDHKFCTAGVSSRILQDRIFHQSSNHELRVLRRLPRCDSKTRDNNVRVYGVEYPWIIDTFCLLDYYLFPVDSEPLAQFKTVSCQGREKLPRRPLQLMIQALRFDISMLSELLRRDLCTILHPDHVLDLTPALLKHRFRIIRAIQNLHAEHSMMLAPHEKAFFFGSCHVCSLYDPEIIRFSRDLSCILLKIFHGQRIKPPSCRYFTPLPEMSDAEVVEEDCPCSQLNFPDSPSLSAHWFRSPGGTQRRR